MTHHGEALRQLIKDEGIVAHLKEDYTEASLGPTDRAMLDYVAKLTRVPSAVSEADVQTLREAGFDEPAILDIALITGYFAFVNRIADGLGLALEDYWEQQ
jgi:uncharacterized peroxidase-related enzyme